MPFEYWGYQFEGAYSSSDLLKSEAGVYVVWCENEGNWSVLDVGEAGDVKERVENHDRIHCWEEHCPGTIYYSATYTSDLQQADRMKIEGKIRSLANPPCGSR